MSSIDKCIKQGQRDPNEPGLYVENLGFNGTIEQNDSDLEFIYKVTDPNLNFHEFKLQLAVAIKAGQITSETMSHEWAGSLINPSIDSSFVTFRHACIYSVLAEIAYGNSETEKAWPLLAKSRNLCGSASACIANPVIGGDTKQRENARKGGKNRGNALLPVRQEVVRLLKSPPTGGWKDSRQTRKAIAKSLTEFKKTKDSEIKDFPFPTDIVGALCRWFNEVPEIREAYEANTAEALSERLN